MHGLHGGFGITPMSLSPFPFNLGSISLQSWIGFIEWRDHLTTEGDEYRLT